MNSYIVRGPNWRIDVELSSDIIGDKDYLFHEAATQAIELIFRSFDNNDFDHKNKPKIGTNIQVALEGYDLVDASKDTVLSYMKAGLLKLIPSPIILANAGKYVQADFLKQIIENED